MQNGPLVSISAEEFHAMRKKLLLPADAGNTDEAVRAKIEGWYQQMLPFAEKMSDQKFDDVAPAIVICGR